MRVGLGARDRSACDPRFDNQFYRRQGSSRGRPQPDPTLDLNRWCIECAAMLVVAFVACLLATSMEFLCIAYCLNSPFGWRWALGAILAAMPLTYFVQQPDSVESILSWMQTNLGEWVSWTQVLSQIALVLAAFVAIVALRTQRATWAATTIWSFQNDWTSERMVLARKRTAAALLKERSTGTVETIPDYLRVLAFFELVGFFCRHHNLPVDDAWVLFSEAAEAYELVCKSRIDRARKADQSFHEEFLYLNQKFREIEAKRGLVEVTDAQAMSLMESEEKL